jgi:hypothetical protein
MENAKKTFKVRSSIVFNYLISIGIAVTVLSFILDRPQITYTLVVILLLALSNYIFDLFIKENVCEIQIEETLIKIKFRSYLYRIREDEYFLNDVSSSFIETVGARGVNLNVLRITKEEKKLVDLIPNYSGFSREKLEDLSKEICKKNGN